jgi:hypothetical protein
MFVPAGEVKAATTERRGREKQLLTAVPAGEVWAANRGDMGSKR